MSFDLTNVGATLVGSGGPGTDVAGGRYWSQDGVDDVVRAFAADCDATLTAITTAVTVGWWVRNSSSSAGSYANMWAKGNVDGLQVRQVVGDETELRFDVNDSAVGEVFKQSATGVITAHPGASWHLLFVTWDGQTLNMWRIVNGTGSADLIATQDAGSSGNAVAWSAADYTIGAQDDESDELGPPYEDYRPQHIVPPTWWDSVLTTTQMEAIYAARDGAGDGYRTTVLDTSPIHFVDESDLLTDTTGVGGGTVNATGTGDLPAAGGQGTATVAVAASGAGGLPAVGGQGTAAVAVAAAGGGTLPPVGGAGTATVAVAGTGVGDLPPVDGSGAAAGVPAGASGGGDLPPFNGTGTSAVAVAASGVGDLPPVDGSGAATVDAVELNATGVGDLPPLDGSGIVGDVDLAASGVGDLPPLDATGTAAVEVAAGGGGTLPPAGGQGSATAAVSASGVGDLPPLGGSGTVGDVAPTATGVGDLPAFGGAGTAVAVAAAAGAGQLPPVGGAGIVTSVVAASGSGSIPAVGGQGSATVAVSASGVGDLPAAGGYGLAFAGEDMSRVPVPSLARSVRSSGVAARRVAATVGIGDRPTSGG